MDTVVSEIRSYTTSLANEVASSITRTFANKAMPSANEVSQCIYEASRERFEALSQIKTPYLRQQYLASRLGLVNAEEIVLGYTLGFEGSGQKRKPVRKAHRMYYVSVEETLKSLNRDQSFQEVLQGLEHNRSTFGDHVSDYSHGSVFQKHPLIQRGDCLPLILYYDDVEICNPLGSYSKVHKLAFFYFTLTSIPAKYRSRLESIFLLGVAYSQDVKKFGMDEILKPFFAEMNVLSQRGTTLVVGGQEKTIKCCLFLLCADTLAAHQILGFKEGVGFSFRKCRHCMCTQNNMSSQFFEECFTLRTIQLYTKQVSTPSVGSVQSGINRLARITKVPHFDIFECAPHDIMHILFEGCIPVTVKLVLFYLIETKKFLTVDELNYQISHFPYTSEDKRDRPSVISALQLGANGALRQSSAQMWLFSRLLPLMVMKHIDMTDKVWQCLVLLLNITSIVMSPRITRSKVQYLKLQIAFYLAEFRSCFPQRNLIPKQHYLVHLPSHILELGPATGYWCMRFEGKHSFFKKLSKGGNFKNIARYLVDRHQHHQCTRMLDSDLFVDKTEQGPKSPVDDTTIAILTNECGISDTSLMSCAWVKRNGNKFSSRSLVLIGMENNLPVFAIVSHVLCIKSDFVLLTSALETRRFDDNLNAYICRKRVLNVHKIVTSSDLLHHESISYYVMEDLVYIPLKVDYVSVVGD